MFSGLFVFVAVVVIYGLKWHDQPAREGESRPKVNKSGYGAVSHRFIN